MKVLLNYGCQGPFIYFSVSTVCPKHVIYDMSMNAAYVTVSVVTRDAVVSCVHSVVSHGSADPAVVAANAGEDAGVSLHGAVVAPGNDPLQLAAAHQRAAGIPLQA